MKKLLLLLTLICSTAIAQDYIPSTDDSTTPQWNDELRKLRDGVSQAKSLYASIYPIDLSLYGTTVKNVLPIQAGGTGASTAFDAMQALLPNQSGHAGQFLTTDSAVYSWGAVPSNDLTYVSTVSNPGVTIATANTERAGSALSYALVKEITLGGGSGSLTISFDLKSLSFAGSVYAKIYKNGSPVGTERNTNSLTYVTYIETISGFNKGDLIQIYGYINTSAGLAIKNFTIQSNYMAINTD